MASAFLLPPPPPRPPRALTERDAVDIWIARWLRIRVKDLLVRYGCDPRRIYEVWEETRFPGTRATARERFLAQYPALADRVDFGPHRRVSHAVPEGQLALFE